MVPNNTVGERPCFLRRHLYNHHGIHTYHEGKKSAITILCIRRIPKISTIFEIFLAPILVRISFKNVASEHLWLAVWLPQIAIFFFLSIPFV